MYQNYSYLTLFMYQSKVMINENDQISNTYLINEK
jgi:hypothetical protein